MSKADYVLEKLHEKLLIGWIVNDGKPHTMPSHGSNDGCTDEAKQQLLADLLAIVGKDEPRPKNGSNWEVGFEHRNQLRAELRQALRSYFGESK